MEMAGELDEQEDRFRDIEDKVAQDYNVIFLLCVLTSTYGLQCLSCHKAAQITDCLSQTAVCQDGVEECFLDKTLLPDLTTVFTAGCRAKGVCSLIASAGKRDLSRDKKDSVLCAACCSSPTGSSGIPCNGYLCNQKPTGLAKTCAICDRTANYSTCAESQQCPANEVCSLSMLVSGGTVLYKLGCRQKTLCDYTLKSYKESAAHGKRQHGDIEICAACCDSRDCNKIDNCVSLRKKQPCFDHTICGN